MMGLLCFTGAVALITIAHLIRIIRWEMFIEVYEKPQRKILINATAIGYLMNYILPFKLGDLIKAYLSGRKMKNGKALGLSTVIVDRYLDIVAVGVVFIFLALCNKDKYKIWNIAILYILLAAVLLFVASLIFYFRGTVKKFLKGFARIFNRKIEAKILRFSWALIWNFKDIFQKLNKLKLVLATVFMWGCYIGSYMLFAAFLTLLGNKTSWTDVFTMLFAQNGLKESAAAVTLLNADMTQHTVYLAAYMLIPLLILIFIALSAGKVQIMDSPDEEYLNLLPHLDERERLNFLENYFSNENRDYVQNYLKINQGISIIRDYSAGSNATTMLCMDEKQTFFRKYAFGEDGEKLYQQIKWIEDNSDKLVLPEIIRQEKTDTYCYYDMPYNPNAVGLFEYAHSMPVENAWIMIKKALDSLEESIYKTELRNADAETISRYVTSKVDKNLKRIKAGKHIGRLLQYEKIEINGVEYNNLGFYEKYLTQEYLGKIFANDQYAVIHGDLTIENIICTRDANGKDDFYIIDPNTGNVHDSPNLDYGKLLQSIHGGYEFLMATKDVKVNENKINFLYTRSSAYKELHNKLRNYMQSELGEERTRSIYFHEIIHWLRLMPYKIDKDDKRSLIFYAGMLMVMNDVIKMYGEL